MGSPDYYEILGVEREADAKALKRAYRALAIQHHPDRNPGDADAEAQFKRVAEAYSVLSDSEKRTRYDQMGHAAARRDPSMAAGTDIGVNLQDVFGDLFDQLFGSLFRKSRTRHGRDLEIRVEISLEGAALGTRKMLRFRRKATCAECEGTGARRGTRSKPCPVCRGTGQVRTSGAFMLNLDACPQCDGKGLVIPSPCEPCDGVGLVDEEHAFELAIPAGVDTGLKLRIEGEGEPGRAGGMNGDLYVVLEVRPHPFFRRRGLDLLCEVPISFPQAALGAEIDVPTLSGRARIKVPSGAESGKVLRLRGMGIADLAGGSGGDILVRLHIETPQKLTSKQRALLEELEATFGGQASAAGGQPRRAGFIEKLRGLFD